MKQCEFPERGRPIHHSLVESSGCASIIFLTVGTQARQPLLAPPEMHAARRDAWSRAGHWRVGRCVILPDHIHPFCAPGLLPPTPLGFWVAYWKRLVAFAVGRSIWQMNFWDTQLRQRDSYSAKWEYVVNNPVRAGLVSRAEDWAYQGELNLLSWHD